jgi:hypothetical protein
MLRNKTLVEELRNMKPDLFVLDLSPQKMMAVLAYKLGVPFAFLGSHVDASAMTASVPISVACEPFLALPYTDTMTFLQGVVNSIFHAVWTVIDPFMPTEVATIYTPEKPFVTNDQLVFSAEIWLVESDHILDYPKPTLPNVKLMGGSVAGAAKPLPPDLQAFMDSAKEGVAVVTFSGGVLVVPELIGRMLMTAFQQLPMKVVFRSNLTSPDPAKILTSTWLPQNDLLGHPNTKVFVSHCGKNGQYEALYHAVPIVCTPIFGDQPYNA